MKLTLKRPRAVSSSTDDGSTKRIKVDRISQLPEPLLHHIISFLTTKDNNTRSRSRSKIWNAATTRLLSKTWNTVWDSFPVLEFDQRASGNSKKSAKKEVQDFCNYVEKSITCHQSDISLQKFQIMIDLQGKGRHAVLVQDILRWLSYAKTKKVRCLSFHCRKNSQRKDEWRYEFPESLFCPKTLDELDLFGCKFLGDGIRTSHTEFCLKKLTLVHVRVEQLSLQSFLSRCPSIQEVEFNQCTGFEAVKLAGVKLERVDFVLSRTQIQTITIEAPNLQYLYCGGDWDNIKSSILGSDCKNVKELMVRDIHGRDSDIEQIVSLKFPLIENVLLQRCCQPDMITSKDASINAPGVLMPRKFKILIEVR